MRTKQVVPHPVDLDHGNQTPRIISFQWAGTTLSLFLLGFIALPHDTALARWFSGDNLPGFIDDILERAETFAHGIGIAAILLTLFIVDFTRRWAFPRVVLATVAAGVAANGFKLLIGRLRPHSADLSAHATDTFTGILPLFSVGSSHRGCPSAHTTVVVAFAIGLCWLYPRGKYLFMTFAVLAATQRLTGNAHFLSDVCWGASLGYFISTGIVSGQLTGSRFDLWERKRYFEQTGSTVSTLEQRRSQPDQRQAA